jgi:hypothetical protein
MDAIGARRIGLWRLNADQTNGAELEIIITEELENTIERRRNKVLGVVFKI